jgi:hypothetical protein
LSFTVLRETFLGNYTTNGATTRDCPFSGQLKGIKLVYILIVTDFGEALFISIGEWGMGSRLKFLCTKILGAIGEWAI